MFLKKIYLMCTKVIFKHWTIYFTILYYLKAKVIEKFCSESNSRNTFWFSFLLYSRASLMERWRFYKVYIEGVCEKG